ncbi:MAG: hypothetical protein H6565_09695 [Lewinellaceae bacterium]|nr:hypothetical protein [Lewinellaceae bacterium]
MRKTAFLLLLAAMYSGACKKGVLPPPAESDPVFSVDFALDTLNRHLTAGVGDIYHFTRLEKGADDVFTSYNAFTDVDCPDGDCPGSLRFEFRSLFATDTTFGGGFYPYTRLNPTGGNGFAIHFSLEDTEKYAVWTLNYGSEVLLENSDITEVDFITTNPEPQSVFLSAVNDAGNLSLYQRTIDPDDSIGYPAVKVLAVPEQGDFFSLYAQATGGPGFEYFWSNGQSDSVITTDTVAGSYQVTVTNFMNRTASAGFEALLGNDTLTTPGFSYTVQPVSNPLQLGTIAIQWVDTQGRIWRSDLQDQPDDAVFQVLAAEPYGPNENGVDNRKLRIAFSCRMFDDTGNFFMLTGSGFTAMAVPDP